MPLMRTRFSSLTTCVISLYAKGLDMLESMQRRAICTADCTHHCLEDERLVFPDTGFGWVARQDGDL